MIIVGIYCLLITVSIFISNELFKKDIQISKEIERKIGHLGFGVIALSAPFVFQAKWEFIAVVGYLLIWFYFIRVLPMFRGGLYDVVHLSSRPTIGDILFPVAVLGMWFMLGENEAIFYIVAILVMSLSDSAASLVGKLYPFGVYKIAKSTKSMSGSFVFFVITIIIFTLFKTVLPFSGTVLVFIAVLATVAEALSGYGLDNITIPIVLYIGFHIF